MFPLYPRTPFFSLPQLYFFSFSEDTNRGLLCTLQGLPWTSPLTFGKSQEKRHALGAIWKTKRRVVGECEYFPLALFDSLIIFAKLLLCDILLFSTTTGNFFHIKMTWKLIGGVMWHPQLSPLYGSVLVRLHVDFQIWPNLTNPTCDTQRRSDFLTPAETQTPWFSLTLVSRSQGKHKMATRKEENKYKTENNSKKSKPCAPFCQ